RMPASGPTKPATSSAITGRPKRVKRVGSPLALMTTPGHCGPRRTSARSRMVSPPMRMRPLSPPPMRRARPPASTSPKVAGSVVMSGCLASVLGGFLLDVAQVLIEHDALFARERDEAFAAGASDQRESGLARQLDPPGSEPRPRHQDRDAHAHRFDHHL